MLVSGLVGCGPEIPRSYVYNGPLIEKRVPLVKEVYHPVEGKATMALTLALLDLNGDKTFDYSIEFNAGEIISFRELNGTAESAYWPREFEYNTRPEGVEVSPVLTGFYEAATAPATAETLEKLYAAKPSKAQAWHLAVQLRNGQGDDTGKIIARAGNALARGIFADQSAFILAGYGEKGVRELGKALRTTTNPKIAEKISAALVTSKTSAFPVLEDITVTLEKGGEPIQRALLQIVEAETIRHPQDIRPFLHRLDAVAPKRNLEYNDRLKEIWILAISTGLSQSGALQGAQTAPTDALVNPAPLR